MSGPLDEILGALGGQVDADAHAKTDRENRYLMRLVGRLMTALVGASVLTKTECQDMVRKAREETK